MKKVLAFLICALLILSASACGSLEVKEDNNSVNSGSEHSEILINANVLYSISIHNVYDEELIRIPVKEDWAFLSKYTKSHTLTKEETNKLLVYPDTHIIYLNTISDDGEEVVFGKIYLLKDGGIVKRQMRGDSGVTDVPYELYKAEEKYMLNEEKLITLLKKYDNSITHME